MTKAMVRKALLELPVKDRLDLQEDLAISIARDEREIPLAAAHKRILRQRLADMRANPGGNISHTEMKKRLAHLKNRFASKRQGNGA